MAKEALYLNDDNPTTRSNTMNRKITIRIKLDTEEADDGRLEALIERAADAFPEASTVSAENSESIVWFRSMAIEQEENK
jgi:hypothetical protein